MDFLLIVLLVLLNGGFAMGEMALAASRKARLAAMAESGDKGAIAALALLEQPTQFLSTVQVGITSIGMLNGIVGEAAYSEGLGRWLQTLGMPAPAASVTATVLVVTLITFVTIIFGELVPKRIAQLHPEAVARILAPTMGWLARAAGPFVRLLSGTTAAVLRLLQIDTRHSRAVTEEEISASLEEGVDAGLIEHQEHRMVQNVFHLDDRNLASLMVPRSDMVWLDASRSVAECLALIGASGEDQSHSWYPVCRGGLDEVIGLVSVARLLSPGMDPSVSLESLVVAPTYVPETLTGMELLEQFRAQARRMVFVVDEYGVVQGLVTPRDLLEAITGELQSEQAHDTWATQTEEGDWLLAGLMPVAELKARLDIDELPEDGRGRYNTVAGLLMAVSGRLPVAEDQIDCAGWRFTVVSLDGRRIDRVLARPVTPAPT